MGFYLRKMASISFSVVCTYVIFHFLLRALYSHTNQRSLLSLRTPKRTEMHDMRRKYYTFYGSDLSVPRLTNYSFF